MLLNILKLRFLLPISFTLLFFISCEEDDSANNQPCCNNEYIDESKISSYYNCDITMNQFVAVMELPMATNVMLKMRASQNGQWRM